MYYTNFVRIFVKKVLARAPLHQNNVIDAFHTFCKCLPEIKIIIIIIIIIISPTIAAGVPQGSILGHLLFILYVKKLPATFTNMKTIQYADDTTLLDHDTNSVQLQLSMNTTLQRVHEWFADNNLSLNLHKTEMVKFSLKEQTQNRSVSFLGMYLDNKLSWKNHK